MNIKVAAFIVSEKSKSSNTDNNGNFNSAHGSSAVNLAQKTVSHQKHGRNLRYTVPLIHQRYMRACFHRRAYMTYNRF